MVCEIESGGLHDATFSSYSISPLVRSIFLSKKLCAQSIEKALSLVVFKDSIEVPTISLSGTSLVPSFFIE